MRAYFFLPIAAIVVVGCAGNLSQRAAQSCPPVIAAPAIEAGDTWNWQDEKGAGWHRRYVKQSDEGLFEAEGRTGGPRYYHDNTHALRKVYRDGQWITKATLDYPELGVQSLDFPLQPGKSWTSYLQARDSNQNMILTYRKTFTVLGCEQVTVPAGTFLAVVIEERQDIMSGPGNGVRTYWYAPDVGFFVKLAHGQASHPSFWASARDWQLTSYTLAKPVADRPALVAPPPKPSTISRVPTVVAPAPTPVTVLSAEPPVWERGYEWKFRWESPRGSGTFIRMITGAEIVGGVPYYVMRSGTRDILYSKSGLDWLMDRVDGAVETRSTPANCGLEWPLVVGKEWEEKYFWENLNERATENRIRRHKVEALESVTVPAGTFQAFRVTSKDPTGRLVQEYWYSPEVKWLVKERVSYSYGFQERELMEYKLKATIAPLP